MTIVKIFHLKGIRNTLCLFLVNAIIKGTNPRFFNAKRSLLNWAGHEIGKGTKVVGPVEWHGKMKIGENCWIGKNCKINGNGTVQIGDNCDFGPEVIFQTGGHQIGSAERRAGEGAVFHQIIGNGVWIGGRSTICNNTVVGDGCVIAGCACVVKSIEKSMLVGGVPAHIIRRLDDDSSETTKQQSC